MSKLSDHILNTIRAYNQIATTPAFADAAPTINAQTGTTYQFVLTDKKVTLNNASPVTVTVPANDTVAFPIGDTQIDVIQKGAGKVTFAAAGGVTINSQAGNLSIAAQYVGVTLVKEGTNTWYLLGNLIS